MDRTEYYKQYQKAHKEHYKEIWKQYREIHKQHYTELVKKWNPKRLSFKGNNILLKHNPRTGVCNLCRGVVGIDCKRTHMHHLKYHDDDPLKDTIELCVACHRKIHVKTYGSGV